MNEELSKLYKSLTDAADGYKFAEETLRTAERVETAALNEKNKFYRN